MKCKKVLLCNFSSTVVPHTYVRSHDEVHRKVHENKSVVPNSDSLDIKTRLFRTDEPNAAVEPDSGRTKAEARRNLP